MLLCDAMVRNGATTACRADHDVFETATFYAGATGRERPKPVVQLAVSIRLLIRTSPANATYHEMKAIMPGIAIELNGSHFITIDLAGMDVVDVSVHGALDQVSKAVLDAHGGNYSDGGCGHLIWVAEQSILPGEALNVKLIEACGITAKGRTIQELYPDDEPVSQTDFTISEEMAAEIRARPRLHKAFSVEAATSNGQLAAAMSNELNTSFTVSVKPAPSRLTPGGHP